MKIVIIDGVEYVPKDTIISETLFDNLAKAYSSAFSIGVYDPTCGSEICRREWRRFFDVLSEINKEVGFKK